MKPKVSIAGLAVACLVALAGCQRQPVDKGATSMKENAEQVGQAVDDATLTTKVKAALAAEDKVDGGPSR